MIIPSIDLQGGQTVQLIRGKDKAIDAGDPRPIAAKMALVGEVAVIDLDAAMGTGSNEALIKALLNRARCRVGGGIRDVETALRWLDAGAAKVILGTAATPEVLSKLPRERVIAAVDARDGEVVVEGWKTGTGERALDRIRRLRDFVGGFLMTFVEIEGTLTGLSTDRVKPILEAAGSAKVTAAGGVKTAEEIAALDKLGVDAQVGMALYTGRIHLADALVATLTSDRADGLFPTVVCDESGIALGMAYSNLESLKAAIDEQRGVYHSRTRGLWRKGESSGAVQELLRIDADCDRDTLRFVVRQQGDGFCHNHTPSCWGADWGFASLERRLTALSADRNNPADGSYTKRLLADPELLSSKLREEAAELAGATDRENAVAEAADVAYFTMIAMQRWGIPISEVEAELDRRALKISRRPGNAKPSVQHKVQQ